MTREQALLQIAELKKVNQMAKDTIKKNEEEIERLEWTGLPFQKGDKVLFQGKKWAVHERFINDYTLKALNKQGAYAPNAPCFYGAPAKMLTRIDEP